MQRILDRLFATTTIVFAVAVLAACGGTDDPANGDDGADNNPPVAEFSVAPGTQVEVSTEVTLDASASSDPDGDSLEYTWGITGPNMEFSQQGSGVSYSFTPPNPGRYEVDLAVTDGTATGRASSSVVVLPMQQENRDPTASVTGPSEVAVGNTVDLIGSGSSDPDGDPLSFSWSFQGGSCDAGTLGSNSGPTVSFTGDQMGSCSVNLEVTDGRGGSDTTSYSVSVVMDQPDNQPPSVVIEGSAGWTGQTVSLRAQASDDSDSVDQLSFQWSFASTPSGSSASIQNAQSQEASFTPDAAGDYEVQVTVEDSEGASTDQTKMFSVTERPDPVKPNAGDIWINEVMVNPSHINDSGGEWIEIGTNATSTNFDLSGCIIRDENQDATYTVPQSAPNFAGNKKYYTLAKADSGSTSVLFMPDATWSPVPSFNNDGDTVDLDCNNQDLDSVTYDSSFPLEEGKTMQLDATVVSSGSPATANNDAANWCAAGEQPNGLYGTPGMQNLACN